MNPSRLLPGLIAALLFSVSASAATLKLKSGVVHEGKIHGLIVLKGNAGEAPWEADPSKNTYTATYTIINGADLTAIDEKGIHAAKAAGIFDVTQNGDPLEDLDIVRTALKIQGGSPYGTTKAAGTVTRVDRPLANPTRDGVLGEYRPEKPELLPTIEIETAKGVVKVPVAEIVQLAAE